MEKRQLTFDSNGYLFPYDVIVIDWEAIINTFGVTLVRQSLLADYERFLDALRTFFPIPHKQWIDGSFISKQENPRDIDVVLFIPYTHFSTIADKLKQLKAEWVGRIDCYFVEIFPPDHIKSDIGRADELTWYYFLRTDRRKRQKGLLELHIGYGN
ncbi:hypothetical protein GCM10028807_41790 [Spirosoma daeguense]